jgi:DNA repair protein RadC
LTRPKLQGGRPILESVDVVLPVGQNQAVIDGQKRIGVNNGFGHIAIVATESQNHPISKWPKSQQPREKLIRQGASALSDAELLAIFLRSGVKGKSAVVLAQDLLTKFKGIEGLMSAPISEIYSCYGMGPSKWAQIQAAYELVKRCLQESICQQAVFSSSAQVREFLQTKIARLEHEVFLCLYLDASNRLIECQELFRGSIDRTTIYPREIIKESLNRNASALVVAHNHPGGSPLPSPDDEVITRELCQALQWVNIVLLDHCIVAKHGFFSFADAGLLNRV